MTWRITGALGTEYDRIYSQAGTPSLDLRFASTKSLTDYVSGEQLIDFRRTSSATYVDSDGLIKKATTNLLLWSEEFDNLTAWPNVVGFVTRTANAEIAPDGTLTADKVEFSGADNLFGQSTTIVSGIPHAVSIWVKGVSGETIRITSNAVPGGTNWTLTGEWQRISYGGVSIGTAERLNVSTYGGATARTIYLWGAQLEQSDTSGEYVKTTSTINSAPRFDHDPVTGESLGLLVEEQRTNLLLQSEEFGNGIWGPITGTVSSNVETSPASTLTADKLIITNGGPDGQIAQGVTINSGATVTGSVFVKAAGADSISVTLLSNNNTTPYGRATFNTSTGAIVSAAEALNGASNAGASVQALKNGWFRCIVTVTYPAVTAAGMRLNTFLNGFVNGDGIKGTYIWGAQLEAGAFATSSIPTTTATVTRSADVVSITGANFSSWYRQDEGTSLIDAFTSFTGATGADFYRFGTFTNGTKISRSGIGATPQLLVADNGTSQAAPFAGSLQPNVFAKIAVIYKVDDFAISTNGSLPSGNAVDTSGSVPQGITTLTFMEGIFGCVRRFTYWPQRLPDTTLQAITQ
jgi:hypothetical protein